MGDIGNRVVDLGWVLTASDAAWKADAVNGNQHGRDQLDQEKRRCGARLSASRRRCASARCPVGNLANSADHERFIPVLRFHTVECGWEDATFGQRNEPSPPGAGTKHASRSKRT